MSGSPNTDLGKGASLQKKISLGNRAKLTVVAGWCEMTTCRVLIMVFGKLYKWNYPPNLILLFSDLLINGRKDP
jgi:hypothetical protein